jgi:hypothetical protein
MIVTFKPHFDIGCTDLPINVVQRYRIRLPQSLTVKRAQPVALRGRPVGRPGPVHGRRAE